MSAPPRGVLVADPAAFDVVAVENPHMAANVGCVDRAFAVRQHAALCAAFADLGLEVHRLDADPALPDLVFTANPSLPLALPDGRRLAVGSRMRHASRAPEVEHHARFWESQGYRVIPWPDAEPFEGCGDLLHVPGREWLLAGHGFRTSRAAVDTLCGLTGVACEPIQLVDASFYHLDTCVMPLGPDAVLWHPDAVAPESRARVEALFPVRIAADPDESRTRLACNAVAVGRSVVIDAETPRTQSALRDAGYTPIPVDTGEFLKSGGSAFCLKNWVF